MSFQRASRLVGDKCRSPMATAVRAVALATLLAASCLPLATSAADSHAAALEMVKRLRLGENMKTIGLQAASRSQTYAIIAKTVGPEKGRAVVTEELERVAPKYQGQWDQNLASAYAPFFAAEELQSITEKQRQSPYINKFMAKQNEVGAAMQSKSSELLKQYVTEAMTYAHRRVAPGR